MRLHARLVPLLALVAACHSRSGEPVAIPDDSYAAEAPASAAEIEPTSSELASVSTAVAVAPEVDEPAGPEPAGGVADVAEPPEAEPEDEEPELPEDSGRPTAVALVHVDGANLQMQEAESDGQRLAALACKADRMPMLGSIALVGAIGKRKSAFDRCAKNGAAAVVHWNVSDRGSTKVEVTGPASQSVRSCVAKAVKPVRAPFSGSCGVVLLIGNAAKADAALEALVAG